MWQRQRGSVNLSYILLAFGLAFVGSLLVSVHKAFALLLPVAALVLFIPNLIGIWSRLQVRYRYHRQLVLARRHFSDSTILLRSGHGDIAAQAAWLDPERNEFGFISGGKDVIVKELSSVQMIRVVFVEASYAKSFHDGQVRMPPRYGLVFEFLDGKALEIVTLKRRRLRAWITALKLGMSERLDLQEFQENP